MRVLARSVADSARLDSDHSPVREADTRARLAAVIAELSAAVRAYGQLLEADPVSADFSAYAAEPITEALEDHLEEAQRQQDQLADLLSTDPAEQPEGWQLRGEILAHVDRLRSELEPGRLPNIPGPAPARPPLRALRDRHWSDLHHERHHDERHRESTTGPRRQPNRAPLRVRARRTAARVSRVSGGRRAGRPLAVVDGLDVVAVRVAQEHAVVAGVVLRPLTRGVQHFHPSRHGRLVHRVHRAPVGRPEGHVQFPGLGAGRRAQPEVGKAVGRPGRPRWSRRTGSASPRASRSRRRYEGRNRATSRRPAPAGRCDQA